MITYEQLSLFQDEFKSDSLSQEKTFEKGDLALVSESLMDSFGIMDVPYIGCNFEDIYPKAMTLLPHDIYTFDNFDTELAIKCELVCAVICHQMNWDFLRHHVYEKAVTTPEWLEFEYLCQIGTEEVYSLLQDYHKQNNIKAEERTELLRLLGDWGGHYSRIINVFVDQYGNLRPYQQIHESLLKCTVFATDPSEKKLNLLLQKLDMVPQLKGLAAYAKPTIDYHLIRLYLRRGLLIVRTKHALQYVKNQEAERRESTVAAIRELCSKLLCQISAYTKLDISTVNNVEWNVARSVCHRDRPDCELDGDEGQWLKNGFCRCPFYDTCSARVYEIEELLKMKEPTYKGTSY